jgi:Tol biopolymer transport system component
MRVFFIITLCLASLSYSQSNTEVYLFDFIQNGENISLSNPVNISNNKGYDNQPSFLSTGKAVLFASTRAGQTDIVLYNIKNKTKKWLTNTSGSEYSPTQTPNKRYFTSILLEKSGRQLLWKYSFDKKQAFVIVENLKIGYHTWYDKNTLVSFVLGKPATLQVSDLKNKTNTIIAKNIGRSLHKIPHSDLISFISYTEETPKIYSINPFTKKRKFITNVLPQSQDMAWMPNGTIVMGSADKLYKFKPDTDKNWILIASLKQYNLTGITRIAVSPKNDKIVLVVSGE